MSVHYDVYEAKVIGGKYPTTYDVVEHRDGEQARIVSRQHPTRESAEEEIKKLTQEQQ